MTRDDPLAELLIDSDAVDRAEIVAALKGRIAVDGRSGILRVQPGFAELDSLQKVAAYGLGRRVAVLLGVADEDGDWFSPAEMVRDTGAPEGTVRPTVSRLAKSRQLLKRGSTYAVSPAQVPSVVALLRVGGNAAKRPPRQRRARRRIHEGSTASSKPEASSDAKATVKSKRSGSPGTARLLNRLIDRGFFDAPRTIGAIKAEIRERTGYELASSTLSPALTRLIRSDVLERGRGANGQFEYVRSND
jgi:hypothetical protein